MLNIGFIAAFIADKKICGEIVPELSVGYLGFDFSSIYIPLIGSLARSFAAWGIGTLNTTI